MSEKKRILIADDSRLILAATAETLRKAGYDVRTAEDAWVAGIVREFQPHLILMDVQFSTEMGGVATRSLKRHAFARETCIVLFSSKPEAELAELAAKSDADGYLRKGGSPRTRGCTH